MRELLFNFARKLYLWTPESPRPQLKRTLRGLVIRLKGVVSGRRVLDAKRIEFPDVEMAQLEDISILAPASNEVLVESHRSSISPGTEAARFRGLPGTKGGFPIFPGYSMAGEIVAKGKRVRDFEVGDRVAGAIGHSSRSSLVPNRLFRIPERVSFESASFIELGIICLQAIRKSRIEPGDRVAVLGQGIIGQLCNRLARVVGAGSVVAIASSRRREAIACMPGGADEFIAASEDPDALARIQADVVIEAVGTPQSTSMALRCCRRGGRMIVAGSARGPSHDLDVWSLIQANEITVVGAHVSTMPMRDSSSGRRTYLQEGKLFLDLLDQERLSVSELITWNATPSECSALYEALAKGGSDHVGIVFDWK